MKRYVVIMVGLLGAFSSIQTEAGLLSRRTSFQCWTWKTGSSNAEDSGHLVSVRGKMEANGTVETPILVDVDGHVVERYSQPRAQGGNGSLFIDAFADNSKVASELTLRFQGEASSTNELFISSEDVNKDEASDAGVTSADVKCHFIPEW